MSKKNRLYVKTEKVIHKVFTQLLNEKNFNQITIKDITTYADINRGTFYLHYQDKYDLLNSCQEKIIDDLKKISAEVEKLNIIELYKSKKSIPFLIEMVNYYKNNHILLKVLLKSEHTLKFQKEIQQLMAENIFKLPIAKEKENKLSIPKPYLIAYIFSAHIGIIQEWFDQGMKEPPEEIANFITQISINGFIIGSGIIDI
ncbi:TetR family transcriptional regulator [Bacillus pseudomycoides]|uniref:TetR/AcrR family transcriptional regulator n=1 Tax=Bacillus pseudomycoides TaxID=64104 RepID=UPI000BF8E898|nr:TetR/AcrR family transcriptional regulator C-terminal domain-containing protein [Bacillus pseudomycoides]PGC26958.1 TetR family transcriptional regulator [Bacillus pseudomycoides]